MKQSKKLTQKLFDGMKPGEIISACKSGKWDFESLILRGEVAVLPLAKHFGLDLTQSTSDLKHMIIDCLENQNSISNPSHNIQKRP